MDAHLLIEQFITSCSHDLRSPNTSIKGLVQVAEMHPHTAEIHECLERINITTDKMEQVLKSLEELLITNQHVTEKVKLNCNEITNEALKPFQAELDKESIVLKQNINVDEQWSADAYTFPLMLNHMLSNAIMYQDKGKKRKRIQLNVLVKDGFTLLQVSDNGIGIPENVQPQIFKPFYKGNEQTNGVGMGLFQLMLLTEKSGDNYSLLLKKMKDPLLA